MILLRPPLGEIKQQQHQIGTGQGIAAARNPQLLHGIPGGPDPCGVKQGDRNAIQHDLTFQQISCGAWQVGHDRPLPATQQVEQGAFAHVGPAHKRHPQSMAHNRSPLAIGHEREQLQANSLQLLQERLTIQGRQILFKVHAGLQLTELIEQALAQDHHFFLDPAIETSHRQLRCPLAARSHQITNRFRPGEIKTAIQHRALAEFTGQGPTHTRLLQDASQDLLDSDHSAVTMNLHNVFAGETARRQHQQHQHLIEPFHTTGSHNMSIENPVALPLLLTRNHRDRCNSAHSTRTRQPNHGDATLPRRHSSSDRSDRKRLIWPIPRHSQIPAAITHSFLRSRSFLSRTGGKQFR